MKRILRKIPIVFLILSAGVMLAWNNKEATEKVKVGDAAPDFKLVTSKGELTSSDLRGKVVLINFFATWCPPCRKELPVLQNQVWAKYKDNKDFVLLVIGREHTEEQLAEFAKAQGFDLPFYPDEDRSVYSQFATQSIPRNYIISKGGKLVYASKGFSNEEFAHMMSVLENQL